MRRAAGTPTLAVRVTGTYNTANPLNPQPAASLISVHPLGCFPLQATAATCLGASSRCCRTGPPSALQPPAARAGWGLGPDAKTCEVAYLQLEVLLDCRTSSGHFIAMWKKGRGFPFIGWQA